MAKNLETCYKGKKVTLEGTLLKKKIKKRKNKTCNKQILPLSCNQFPRQEIFQKPWYTYRPDKFIRNDPVYVGLEIRKHREPDLSPLVGLLERPRVRQGVIIEKEAGGDVEGNDDVDGVMLMSGQDEENTKDVQYPGEGVEEVEVTRRI